MDASLLPATGHQPGRPAARDVVPGIYRILHKGELTMRTLLKFSMEVEATNKAIQEGKLQSTMKTLLDQLKPEATFYTAEWGKRTGYIFFELKETSVIPQICEPLFQLLNAEIELKPVMNSEDLVKGLQGWQSKKAAA
jgi:hypothetical protein